MTDALRLRRHLSLARLLLVLYVPATPERAKAEEALGDVLQTLADEAEVGAE